MSVPGTKIGIRWTIGAVSERGFEALRLSIWGAWRLFGEEAAYVVCCNTVPLDEARARTGPLPRGVAWHEATGEVPPWIRPHFEEGMAEGVGWKFAPLRHFPDRYELALDNDCILWALPETVRCWLERREPDLCLMAEDTRRCLGQFDELCGPLALNSGIRGLPPGFDLEAALRHVLEEKSRALGQPVVMTSELDEQGLQAAALALRREVLAVRLDEVTICSPFWPHRPELGRCGAHFVGLNARHIPWDYYERPADEWMREHWARHRPRLYELTGAPREAAAPLPLEG